MGELVENLIDIEYPEGKHKNTLEASHLSSGIYFLKIEGNEFLR